MFTGLIQTTGLIRCFSEGNLCVVPAQPIEASLGASIAVNGICLTVTRVEGAAFWFHLSAETLARTTARHWREGMRLNLEPALRMGDPLGGHLVSGHVDGVAQLTQRTPEGECWRMRFAAQPELLRYIAVKGSVAVDGISLTVNAVDAEAFEVMVIPHTLAATIAGEYREGARVNLEVDQLARYVERLMVR